MPKIEEFLDYEIRSSLWASWMGHGWLQSFASFYFAQKVNRKYKRYMMSKQMGEFFRNG